MTVYKDVYKDVFSVYKDVFTRMCLQGCVYKEVYKDVYKDVFTRLQGCTRLEYVFSYGQLLCQGCDYSCNASESQSGLSHHLEILDFVQNFKISYPAP